DSGGTTYWTFGPGQAATISGGSAGSLIVGRPASGVGQSMTLGAGGGQLGGTDMNGGDLILNSGTATGSGSSNIQFKTAVAGVSGTTDRAPQTRVTIAGSNVGIGSTIPGTKLELNGGDFRIKNASGGYVDFVAPSGAGTAAYTFPTSGQ